MNHETHETHEKIRFNEEVFVFQGAIFDVYREMGCGFLEAVYQECLGKKYKSRGIPFLSQKELVLTYKGQALEQQYKPDSGSQREIEDYRLSRYACYLIVQNGDPSKPVIADGQTNCRALEVGR